MPTDLTLPKLYMKGKFQLLDAYDPKRASLFFSHPEFNGVEGPHFFFEGSEAWRAQFDRFLSENMKNHRMFQKSRESHPPIDLSKYLLIDVPLDYTAELQPFLCAHRLYGSDIIYLEGEALPVSEEGARILLERCDPEDTQGAEVLRRWQASFGADLPEAPGLPDWVELLAQRIWTLLGYPTVPLKLSSDLIETLRDLHVEQRAHSKTYSETWTARGPSESEDPGTPSSRVIITYASRLYTLDELGRRDDD